MRLLNCLFKRMLGMTPAELLACADETIAALDAGELDHWLSPSSRGLD